jgi:hypothetical protein
MKCTERKNVPSMPLKELLVRHSRATFMLACDEQKEQPPIAAVMAQHGLLIDETKLDKGQIVVFWLETGVLARVHQDTLVIQVIAEVTYVKNQ